MQKIYGLKGLCEFFDISMTRARNLVKHGCIVGYVTEVHDPNTNKVTRVWDAKILENAREFVNMEHFEAIRWALHYKQVAQEYKAMYRDILQQTKTTQHNFTQKITSLQELEIGKSIELQNGCKYTILELDKNDNSAKVQLLNSQGDNFYHIGDKVEGWFSSLGSSGDIVFCSRRERREQA